MVLGASIFWPVVAAVCGFLLFSFLSLLVPGNIDPKTLPLGAILQPIAYFPCCT
jgi:hypothetical protein